MVPLECFLVLLERSPVPLELTLFSESAPLVLLQCFPSSLAVLPFFSKIAFLVHRFSQIALLFLLQCSLVLQERSHCSPRLLPWFP